MNKAQHLMTAFLLGISTVQAGEIFDFYPDAIIRITEQANRMVMAAHPCSFLKSLDDILPPDPPALRGAKTVLASYFQSCLVLEEALDAQTPYLEGVLVADRIAGQRNSMGGKLRRLENREQMVASHLILNQLANDENYPGPNCRDMTQTPPVYGYGSRLTMNRETRTINIFSSGSGVANMAGTRSPGVVAVDCSAFISASLATAGLKVSKNGPEYTADLTTTSMNDLLTSRNSCLATAEFSAQETLKPGDMINLSGNHVVMVDTVSDDPLGIKKHLANNTCDDLTADDFDFVYIHSGSINNSYGPSRVHISTDTEGRYYNNMRTMAVAQCKRLARGRTDNINSADIAGRGFSIIRHKSNDPDCLLDERIKIEGEECIEGCFRG